MKFTLIIKKNSALKYVLKKGEYFPSKYIVVHCINNNKESNKNFLGICVSKKNGISVHRNKLKRWAREAYKYEENSLKKGYNIVILFRKNSNTTNLNYNIVVDEIKKCFKELDLYERED